MSRWRATTRIAVRQARRAWTSSLLIVALVAVPIMAMTGGSIYVASRWPTPQEKISAEVGTMQAWVQPAGAPGSGLWQVPWNPRWTGYITAEGMSSGGGIPDADAPRDPRAALPAGTEVVQISRGQARLTTRAGTTVVEAWAGAVGDARLSGRFDLVDGRAPRAATDVLVTAAVLERTGAVVGGRIELDGQQYEVSGVVRVAGVGRDVGAVAFTDAARFASSQWLLPDQPLTWEQVQTLNAAGFVAYSRTVVLDPPPFSMPDGESVSPTTEMLANYQQLALVLGAGALAAGYMVVMLAGAAFAVSARRQQRALAVAASVGADSTDVSRIVRLQGAVLGAVGGVVGAAAGTGLAAVVIAATDDGSRTRFWGFHVPWVVVIAILAFALLVGTAAALMPARGVAKNDVLRALRGARRPQSLAVSRPLAGSLLLLVGIGVTFVSALIAAGVATLENTPSDSPLRWLPIVGIVLGPIVVQVGIVMSGRWLLAGCARVVTRVSVSARIAARDAVANGARTVPAFAAIAATVFSGVFAVAMGGMISAQTIRLYDYAAPIGVAVAQVYPMDTTAEATEADAAAVAAAAASMLRDVGATATATIARQQPIWAESADAIPADLVRAVAVTPERARTDPAVGFTRSSNRELRDPSNNLTIVAPEAVATVTGVQLTPSQRAEYATGAALVLAGDVVTKGTVAVAAWTEREWYTGLAPDNFSRDTDRQNALTPPQWSVTLPAIEVGAGDQAVGVAIAPSTAERLGIRAVAAAVYGAFPDVPTTDQKDRIAALTPGLASTAYTVTARVEEGPRGVGDWLVPLLALVTVTVLGASAVALGLARFERRPDDATLAAVGGSAMLRRNIAFWQGLVIAGFGTVAGAAAGVLPPLGFVLQSRATPQALDAVDIWWPTILVVVLGLPLAVAVVNWLVPPRRADLTRRTTIA
ncbi:FtsX-like permease family protein [uncultured Microbacterium sp.]|uniref:FtsX-like permease family protein n=1 Tax=uncultured Microbacterium sp. TaxID=191216 RepID=UPI0025DFE3C1|nr:FtsX-like permease family protein [uncultured Microbacterium sp.]